MDSGKLFLVDTAGNEVAELTLTGEADDWFSGAVLAQQFSPQLKEALDWYDEVVENQMLSFLDGATDAVEQFGLLLRHADGTTHQVFSLHVNKQNEVSFRTSPIPPPVWLAKSESA